MRKISNIHRAILFVSTILVVALISLTWQLYLQEKWDVFVTIDACLDDGGRWNYSNDTCEK